MRSHDSLREEFLELLASDGSEQSYQDFLELHSQFIPREFIQNHGVHLNLVLRKLSMARDYTSDFFYLAKSSGDWNCVLVELEKPTSRLFKTDNSLSPDFLKGLDQVDRWRAWFLTRGNFDAFLNGTIGWLRVPVLMRENPSFIKYVLVIGRRSEIEDNELRRRLVTAREREDFKILSYDSLLEDLWSKPPLYVGVRRNEFIEIISQQYAGDSVLTSLPPERLRINPALRADILAHKDKWYKVASLQSRQLAVEKALPQILDAN